MTQDVKERVVAEKQGIRKERESNEMRSIRGRRSSPHIKLIHRELT